MNSTPLFGLSVAMSFVAFGIVTQIYIWPRLRTARREQALIALTSFVPTGHLPYPEFRFGKPMHNAI
jgi:hypothetical protein